MKSFLKTITAFLVLVLLLSSSALALYWYDEEFVWTKNNQKELLIAKGDSAEFTTGTFVNNEPVYLTIKLIGDDFTKVLVSEEKITFPNYYDVPYKYTIKPLHYNNEAGNYKVTVTLDDKFGVNSAQTHYLDLTVWGGKIVFPKPEPKNNPPVLEPLKDSYTNTEKDGPVSYKLTASDKDGDKITIEAQRYFKLVLFGKVMEIPLSLPEGFYVDFGKNVGKFGMVVNYDTVQHPKLEDVFLLKFRAYDGKDYSDWQYTQWKIFDVDRAPVLTLEDQQVNEEELLSYKIKAEDKDGDKLTFSAGQVRSPYLPKGAVLFKDTGVFLWTPDNTQAGEYQIVVKIDDGFGKTDKGIFTITVNQKNVPPVMGVLQDFSVYEGETKTLTVKATDSDPGTTLTYEAKVKICKLMFNKVCVSSDLLPLSDYYTFNEQTGEFKVAPGYDLIKHPDKEKTGKVVFRAYDGEAYSEWATTKITFMDVNRAPVAISDAASTLKDKPVIVKVLENDYDADGDTLEVTLVTSPNNGYAKVVKGKEVEYTPLNGFTGVDAFDYIVTDGYGGKNSASVRVNVSDVIIIVNNPPVANNDSYATTEDVTLNVNAPGVLGNDVDADLDKLTAKLKSNVKNGQLTLNADGSFIFVPNANFNGQDSFTYVADDGKGGNSIATVTITVVPKGGQNHPPVANDDVAKTDKDKSITVDVLANDTDPDGDKLAVVSVSNPANGKAVVNNNKVDYTPNPKFEGVDTFNYVVDDSNGGQATAKVTVTVGGIIIIVNNPPVFVPVSNKVVNEGELVKFDVVAKDKDPDDLLTYKINFLPGNAQFADNDKDGIYTFAWQTGNNDAGGYTLTFTVSDGKNVVSMDVVITVNDVVINLKPVIVSQPVTLAIEGQLYTYQLKVVDDSKLAYKLVKGPGGMSMSNTGLVEWTPEIVGCFPVVLSVSDVEYTVEQKYTVCVTPAYKNLKFTSVQLVQDVVYAGDQALLKVNIKNNGDAKMGDLQVSAMVYDLGIETTTAEFTLKSGESTTKTVSLFIPYYAEPGQYLVKVIVGNSQYHDATYRMINVE